jgi:hypothetical protein
MPDPTEFQGRPTTGGVRSAALVAIVVIAFVVLAVAKPWDGPAPSPSPLASAVGVVVTPPPSTVASQAPSTPVASPSATVAPIPFSLGPSPADGAPWGSITWQRLDPASPVALLRSVVTWRGGWVAIGDGGSPVWTSTDGDAWQPLPAGTGTTFWPDSRVLAVAPGADGLVAITISQPLACQPTDPGCVATPSVALSAWSSPDARTWRVLPATGLPPLPRAADAPLLAAGPRGLVLAWQEPTALGSRTRITTSADGRTWRPVPDTALPATFSITDLAVVGGRYVASGRLVDATGGARAALIGSSDGAAWSLLSLPDATGSQGERQTVVWRLVDAPAGVLAVGVTADTPGRELWWWSQDGRRWQVVRGFAPLGSSRFPPLGPTRCPGQGCGDYPDGLVIGDGSRMLAFRVTDPPAAWTSADGQSWQAVAIGGDAPARSTGTALLLPGGILLAEPGGAWYGQASAP